MTQYRDFFRTIRGSRNTSVPTSNNLRFQYTTGSGTIDLLNDNFTARLSETTSFPNFAIAADDLTFTAGNKKLSYFSIANLPVSTNMVMAYADADTLGGLTGIAGVTITHTAVAGVYDLAVGNTAFGDSTTYTGYTLSQLAKMALLYDEGTGVASLLIADDVGKTSPDATLTHAITSPPTMSYLVLANISPAVNAELTLFDSVTEFAGFTRHTA